MSYAMAFKMIEHFGWEKNPSVPFPWHSWDPALSNLGGLPGP